MPASNLMPSNGYFNMFSWNYCYVKCFGRITKLSRGKVKKDHKKVDKGPLLQDSPPPLADKWTFWSKYFFPLFCFSIFN